MIIKLTDKEAREVCAGLFRMQFDTEQSIEDLKKQQEMFKNGPDLSECIEDMTEWYNYISGICKSVNDKITKAKYSTFKIGL